MRVGMEASGHANCRNQAWLLKNSIFFKAAKIWGMEMPRKTEKAVLWGFLLQSFFGHFLVSEFFNSHGIFRQPTRQVNGKDGIHALPLA